MTQTYKATWIGDKAALGAAADALSEVLHPPAGAVSLMKGEDSDWRLEAYFDTAPEQSSLDTLVADFAGLPPGTLEALPAQDWVAHALEGLGVVRCGRFVLYGAHDAENLPGLAGDIPIRIDANEAFGTGHHPTTAGCLEILDRLAGFAPKHILDLGCGSAVLAIAAAKAWGRSVLALDIDPRSVEIARENVALNDVDDRITIAEADGFSSDLVREAAPFDFVFANILAGPLQAFAPDMAAHVKKNGRILLAGLMAEQEHDVLNAYEKAGFRLLNRLDHSTWPVLLLVRT
ncbi:MAG: 50S ribosomal protein L11 methyltransferase [Pseudomonadota bacterium]